MTKISGGTLQDVANAAGVSKTTAAAILRDAPGLRASVTTRQRVLEASRRVGYRRNAVATSLKHGRTDVIGVLLPLHRGGSGGGSSRSHSWRSYQEELLLAVLQAAARVGLSVLPVPMTRERGSLALLPEVTDRRIDGLILAAIYDEPFRAAVETAGVPCVEISGDGPFVVAPDNWGGAMQAVAHLATFGHRRIAHWYGGGGLASEERRAGFEQKSAEMGMETASVVRDAAGLRSLLTAPPLERITGLFAFNDYLACSALAMARDAGLRVSEDLSIVGFDDGILAETAVPALTTLHNPLDEQAEAAISLLNARLRGEDSESARIVVPTRLVVRGSTAAAPVFSSPPPERDCRRP